MPNNKDQLCGKNLKDLGWEHQHSVLNGGERGDLDVKYYYLYGVGEVWQLTTSKNEARITLKGNTAAKNKQYFKGFLPNTHELKTLMGDLHIIKYE